MLRHIEIENFRSCYATTVDFTEGVSALVEKNGVGKSNVLKCIEWVAASSISTQPLSLSDAGNELEDIDEISMHCFLRSTNRSTSTA